MKFCLKKSLSVLTIFLSLGASIHGQSPSSFCGTEIDNESLLFLKGFQDNIKVYENEYFSILDKNKTSKTDKNTTPTSLNSIPVKAHIIRSSSGNGGLELDELYKAITDLNVIYADAYMEFFLCDGINYINNDDYYYKFNRNQEIDLTENSYVPGVINIYFTEYVEVTPGFSLCGYSNTFGGSDVIVMSNGCGTNGTSLAHELGHFFSLMHTHGLDSNALTSELVDGSNCDTDGDMICDTPADPKLSTDCVNSNCEYTGSLTDAHGDVYKPDTKNIMSYTRPSCKSHFSEQQLARIYAFYKSARQYLSCPSANVNFTANSFQECGNELTVNFTDTSVGATSWQWDVDGDNVTDYRVQNPVHTYTKGVYDVTLTITTGNIVYKEGEEGKVGSISKTFSQIIKVGTEEDATLNVDFDSFDFASSDGWSAIDLSGNGFNWLVNSGETVSSNTGPIKDKTSKKSNGKYIYTEASGAKEGDIAEFVSPCININQKNAQLEFFYHMYGDHIGELHVDIETENDYIADIIPALIGEQQTSQSDDFIAQYVNLSRFYGQTINIHFRAIRGYSWSGDIAIDGVSITGNAIADKGNNKPTLKLFPNPVTNGVLNISTISEKRNPEDYFTVSNLVGQVFLTGKITGNEQIDVSQLPKGSYLVTVISGKNMEVKQFIK
ncbi:Por secretion system C-terminal sorting domain-containing protein [Hyunsoonleella jejuensis]|uniref:Por secretion system C-terminal sorting domain-containing protein n=1 Tax=Hyunsoonleella jejuensis TaxID=419940 RepID=A0A1H9DCR2_9FLAO|nr:T9SS type A sorting domain-containing protein [Hyunsoonleella jejuensis]SEQ11285.1 Por secretion system C-terminal sorting domain-containing protein [Hyunsoonleella jejuensis]